MSRRNILIGAGVVGAAVFLFPRTTAKANPVGNVFDTPASQSVGDRYSAGGGSNTHLPGAATRRGDASQTHSSQETHNGVGTPAFQDKHGDQKVIETSSVGKAFHNAQYGELNDKGK
nr:hypothetical protein CFP56_78336 [Quercus suber]